MLVSEAITALQSSELKQLKVGEVDDTVLSYINFGVLELHKRFNLWESEATVTIVDGKVLYELDGADANVAIDLSDHDILNTQEVWLVSTDDNIFDSKLPLNNDKDPNSVFTPQFHQIKINTPLETGIKRTPYIIGDTMTVVYRAAPIFMTAITDTIKLPQQFLEALFLYVGYKGQGSIKSGERDENNAHFKRFQASCDRIKLDGIHVQDTMESNKFYDRGYV